MTGEACQALKFLDAFLDERPDFPPTLTSISVAIRTIPEGKKRI
jgi:hypothetical protein